MLRHKDWRIVSAAANFFESLVVSALNALQYSNSHHQFRLSRSLERSSEDNGNTNEIRFSATPLLGALADESVIYAFIQKLKQLLICNQVVEEDIDCGVDKIKTLSSELELLKENESTSSKLIVEANAMVLHSLLWALHLVTSQEDRVVGFLQDQVGPELIFCVLELLSDLVREHYSTEKRMDRCIGAQRD